MRRLLPLVCTLVAVDTILYAALVPLLPHYVQTYGLSKTGAGLLAAMFAIGALAGGLPGGAAAARFGPRAAVLAGLTLMATASLAFGWAGTIEALWVARFLQGFGSSLTWAGALSWLAVVTPRERLGAAMGTAMGAAIVGALLGPVLGAAASVVGTRAAFTAVAALGIVLSAWALRFAPPPADAQPIAAAFRALGDRGILAGLWLMTLPAILFGVLVVLMPLALDDAGFGAIAIGAVWLVAAALEAVLNPLIGHASDRFGRLAPVRIGLVAALVVSLLLAVLSGPVALVALTLAAGVAYGAFYTPSLLVLSDSAERIGLAQGLVFGLMSLAWATGNTLGPLAGGALADAAGDALPYALAAGLCAVTLVFVRRLEHEGAAVLVDGLAGDTAGVGRE
jgi:MFS family permease